MMVVVFGALGHAGRWGTISARLWSWEKKMDGWKKAVVAGSIGAAAILFMKRRYASGVLATGVGLAVVASEYPEKFEKVRQAMPEYFERGMRIMEMAERAGRRITEAAGQSAAEAWEEIGG
jgi:cytosine/adenosine deaminase-related metal-dependent hydrolase